MRDGQKRRLEIPVITGCIFVRVSEVNLPSVLSIWGVIALLQEKQVPVVISDEQLESFKILNERAETLEIVNEGLPVGSAIRVLQGELAGVQGGRRTTGCGSYSIFDRMCGKGKSVITYPVKYKKSVFLT